MKYTYKLTLFTNIFHPFLPYSQWARRVKICLILLLHVLCNFFHSINCSVKSSFSLDTFAISLLKSSYFFFHEAACAFLLLTQLVNNISKSRDSFCVLLFCFNATFASALTISIISLFSHINVCKLHNLISFFLIALACTFCRLLLSLCAHRSKVSFCSVSFRSSLSLFSKKD